MNKRKQAEGEELNRRWLRNRRRAVLKENRRVIVGEDHRELSGDRVQASVDKRRYIDREVGCFKSHDRIVTSYKLPGIAAKWILHNDRRCLRID